MKALVDELKGLRSGRGATYIKVSKCPSLMQYLDGDPVEALWDKCKRLGGGKQVDALVNAYAFGMSNPWNLTRRRADFAVAIASEEGRVAYSTDTVELWENESIKELVHLLTGEEPQTTTDDIWELPELMPLTAEEILADYQGSDDFRQSVWEFLRDAYTQLKADQERFNIRSTVLEDMHQTFINRKFTLPPWFLRKRYKARVDHFKRIGEDYNKMARELQAEAFGLEERQALLDGLHELISG